MNHLIDTYLFDRTLGPKTRKAPPSLLRAGIHGFSGTDLRGVSFHMRTKTGEIVYVVLRPIEAVELGAALLKLGHTAHALNSVGNLVDTDKSDVDSGKFAWPAQLIEAATR